MSTLAEISYQTTTTTPRTPLVLVQPVPRSTRIDLLALSGAVLLLLVAALPGLTRWANRLDRGRRRW